MAPLRVNCQWGSVKLSSVPAARITVYAWHPLPVWEFAGSGHIDAAIIALDTGETEVARVQLQALAGAVRALRHG